MNERKQIMIRVPHDLAKKYLVQAESEGFGSLTAWIVSVLNQKIVANKMLTECQQEPLQDRNDNNDKQKGEL